MKLLKLLMLILGFGLSLSVAGCSDEPSSNTFTVNGKAYYPEVLEYYDVIDDYTEIDFWAVNKSNAEKKFNIPYFVMRFMYDGDINQVQWPKDISDKIVPVYLDLGSALMGSDVPNQHLEFRDISGKIELESLVGEELTIRFINYSVYAIPASDRPRIKAKTYKLNGLIKFHKYVKHDLDSNDELLSAP